MKTNKLLLFTAIITFSAFAAIIYSSCRKDSCKGVSCQNGGTCSQGVCQCPLGYAGTSCNQSTIIYINDAYTPVTLTVNDVTHILAAQGGFASYIGTVGSQAVVTGYTAATSSSGKQVGNQVTWSFSNTFPSGGNGLTVPIDVPKTYFYLIMANADSHAKSVNYISVNYGLASQITDTVNLPNNGVEYPIGYFLAFPGTKVYASDTSISGDTWILPTSIPDTTNATDIVVIP